MKSKRIFLIKESLRRKLVSRWFIGINILLFILIFITFNINSIINFFGGDFKEEKTIYVIDNIGIFSNFKKEVKRLSNVSITDYKIIKKDDDIDILKDDVKNNSNIILLRIIKDKNNYFKGEIYTRNGISILNENIISSSLQNIRKEFVLKDLGIEKKDLDKLEGSVLLEKNILEEKKVNYNNSISLSITVLLFLIPSFFIITILVQMIGAEINEEKSTKSMEIIISNVTPLSHLIAKIVSCSLFTLIQISLIIIFGFISSMFSKSGIGGLNSSTTEGFIQSIMGSLITKDFIRSFLNILPILIPSFLLTIITYALLASVFASISTNIDDFQQLQTPLMFIISIGFYLSLLSILFEGSIFIKIMSFVPLISFMLAPTLYILGQISINSLFISFLLQIIFLIIMVSEYIELVFLIIQEIIYGERLLRL